MKKIILAITALLAISVASISMAAAPSKPLDGSDALQHSGDTTYAGCHMDHSTGIRHCH